MLDPPITIFQFLFNSSLLTTAKYTSKRQPKQPKAISLFGFSVLDQLVVGWLILIDQVLLTQIYYTWAGHTTWSSHKPELPKMHEEHQISRPNFNPTSQTQTDLKFQENLLHNLDNHRIFSPDLQVFKKSQWWVPFHKDIARLDPFYSSKVSFFFLISCYCVFPFQFQWVSEVIRWRKDGFFQPVMKCVFRFCP